MGTQEFYLDRLKRYGATAKGVGWGSERLQRVRFEVMASVGIRPGETVLDAGCGVGHFADFLFAKGLTRPGLYTGIDDLPSMVSEARGRLPGWRFELSNMQTWTEPSDIILVVGAFWNYVSEEAVLQTVKHLLGLSRRGVAFTLRSGWGETPGDLAFMPDKAVELFRGLSRWMVLRHDYHPEEMTIFLYHRSPWEQSQ